MAICSAYPNRSRPLNLVLRLALGFLLVNVTAGLEGAFAQADTVPAHLRVQYDSAYFAWDRGDYVQSLQLTERILTTPGGERLSDRIALLTGELYRVHEVAPDGRFLRWSPDGRHFSFETGTGGDVQTHLIRIEGGRPQKVAEFDGWNASFSPLGGSLAHFRTPETPALVRARERERRAVAGGSRSEIREARREIAELESAAAEIIIREVAGDEVQVVPAEGIERFGLAYTGGGDLILVGRFPDDGERIDLFLLQGDAAPRRLSEGPGNKGRTVVPAGPDRIVYTLGDDSIAIHDLRSGSAVRIAGRMPTVSRDGSTLAYIATVAEAEPDLRRGEAVVGADIRATGQANALIVQRLGSNAAPRELKRTTLPLADLALSPSGNLVAYNTILRDDWEVFVAETNENGVDRRLTTDIQHDLFPRFLSEDRLLTLMGEARHRRSYVYDLSLDTQDVPATLLPGDDQRGRTRLFHNNTIRTVAPQYEWEPSPDGTRVAIVADRDGNTLSAERGVFLVDFSEKVGVEDLLERIRMQREAETELRTWGREVFAPIEGTVRDATSEVDAGRVYDHAHALYQFGSKFITQPGNAEAIEYLERSLRAMGYEPELQWFEPRPGIRSANVVATLRGTERPESIHVVSSHFDSVEGSPGADDNTSGTTALLEVARVLANRPQPETIRFAWLTGEEAGLLGGRELVRRALADGDRIVSALNNDMIGWTRSHRLDNTIRYSNDTIRDLQHNAAILFSDLITYDARYVLSTDAQAFYDAFGDIIGGIGSYPILGNPHYHQRHDMLEVIDHRLVAEVARTTVATVMRLANGLDLNHR
ncbi:MAG: M28 family peptidase [Gemmatimonas sp.]|nr:M28 family peptidase [Gemmatimonas sp.]